MERRDQLLDLRIGGDSAWWLITHDSEPWGDDEKRH